MTHKIDLWLNRTPGHFAQIWQDLEPLKRHKVSLTLLLACVDLGWLLGM
jgi:hypothetical protein